MIANERFFGKAHMNSPSERTECSDSCAALYRKFGRLCSQLIGKQPVVLFLDHRIALASALLQSFAV